MFCAPRRTELSRVSKLLPMTKPAVRIAHRKTPPPAVHSNTAFQLPLDPGEEKAGFEKITKWLELADAMLNEPSAYRKRA